MTVKAKADAIDKFVRTLRSAGLYDDIQAACIMAGWTNLAGALTPFKGSAPTNVGGLFQNADLDPGIGLKGNGSSKYLNTNRAGNADGQNDRHVSAFVSDRGTSVGGARYIASGDSSSNDTFINNLSASVVISSVSNTAYEQFAHSSAGFFGGSRNISTSFDFRFGGSTSTRNRTSGTPNTENFGVFCRSIGGSSFTNATLSWYSIGSATDLAALDSAVSTLMSDLRAIDEDGFDRDALAYIRAVEAADGSFLETGVKQAINSFIVGCKKDGIWDALKASCILCGARTIAGALVPLAGTAPTAYNFVSANYNRETGLVGVPASNTYIDTNRANNADGQDDAHLAVYKSDATSEANPYFIGESQASGQSAIGQNGMYIRSTAAFATGGFASSSAGLHATSRSGSSSVVFKRPGSSTQTTAVASVSPSVSQNAFVFALNSAGTPVVKSSSRFAFYSIGSAIPDLSLLDARITTLVSQIAAAIP